MAAVGTESYPSLSEQYLLREQEEKLNVGTEPVADVVKTLPEEAAPKEDVASVVESSPVIPSATDDESSVISGDAVSSEEVESGDNNPAASEESNQDAADDSADVGQDASEDEPPEIKLETAPADFRFPTTNQSRHCFTRYVEFHRCVASKGDSAPECDKFAKYYRSLCPGEWVDRWNEQRENGTFPGPL
ncbi:unnamed protein product [Cuscuta epithymum]|uniref:Cytochrome c oxidase subunit n=1 Tax=Cuscuta epithymum TaxID=186058 RepID=A0AAV0BZR4_9ASTE|nr:unnamed protein product [Cuscuta epithymum]CAH9143459.1 unnamed protein product [Cuscuta epithymum]